jgi:hypothetical protein
MRTERFAAATGAVYVVAVLFGNEMANAGASGKDTGPAILADLQRPRSGVNIAGTVMEVLGFALLIVFVGYLYRVLRRAEGPDGWWAAPAFGAGLVTVAVKLASAAPFMAAHLRASELSPELARTLIDMNGAAFVISGFTWGIFVLAAAAAALSGRVLPQWLGIVGVVVGVLTIAAGVAGILDPLGYVPIPFLLGLLWVLAVSIVLTVRRTPRDHAQTAQAAESVPAGASATA